ncbi:LOB domain-containing protein 37-like [Olea europaea var. sylvestris]|uniref:LOB domain-containing protein 37-like n=1 Tax=Olea europaea var. sylvestris TaxID=158386 RepID=UPI000C1CFFC1|nr:LOB domain-containing protein 37-like [Olea europaea var. sylvestris]
MSSISSVPDNQRPDVFQSLLLEAAGRTVNPMNGALGLLWTGNWHVCQAAVETVLQRGALRSIPEFLSDSSLEHDNISECTDMFKLQQSKLNSPPKVKKHRLGSPGEPAKIMQFVTPRLFAPRYAEVLSHHRGRDQVNPG